MTKIKKNEVVQLFNFLSILRGREKVENINLKTEEWKILADNETEIEEAVKEIDKRRRELVVEFSNGKKEDGVIKVEEDKEQAFRTKAIEMLEEEVEINLGKISLESFGDSMQGDVGIMEFMKYVVTK